MRKRLVSTALLAAIGGAVGIGIIALVAGGSEAGSPKEQAAAKPVGPEGRELLALLQRGREHTFRASYRPLDERQVGITMEMWRRPPLERQDVVSSTGRSSSYQLRDGTVVCSSPRDGEWTCKQAEPAALGGTRALLDEIGKQLSGKKVAARDETIDGRSARCFVLSLELEDAELCLTPDGVPLRVITGDTGFVLTALSTDVQSADFEPPAGTL